MDYVPYKKCEPSLLLSAAYSGTLPAAYFGALPAAYSGDLHAVYSGAFAVYSGALPDRMHFIGFVKFM